MVHLSRKMMYGLDPAGGRVWEALDRPATFEELVRLLPVEVGADTTADAALASFLADLSGEGLVTVEPGLPERDASTPSPRPGSSSRPVVAWREEIRRFAGACAFHPGVSVVCDRQPFKS